MPIPQLNLFVLRMNEWTASTILRLSAYESPLSPYKRKDTGIRLHRFIVFAMSIIVALCVSKFLHESRKCGTVSDEPHVHRGS